MTLSIKNFAYAFLRRLDLIFSMSLWKESRLLQMLNDLSIRYLIKLILHESDVKLLKFKSSSVWVDLWWCLKSEILIIDTWNEFIKKSHGMAILFFYSEFNIRMPIIKKI